jgi:hypothetical protein
MAKKKSKYSYQLGGESKPLSLYLPKDKIVDNNNTQSTYAKYGGNMKKSKYIYQTGGIVKDPNIKGPIGFLNSYFESPEFQRKSGTDYDLNMSNYRRAVKLYLPKVVESDPEGSHAAGVKELLYSRKYEKKGHPTVVLDKSEAKKYKMNLFGEVLPHEYSHNTRRLFLNEEAEFAKRNKNSLIKRHYDRYLTDPEGMTSNKSFSEWVSPITEHGNIPSENYADLNALRYFMYDKGIYDARKGPMTIEHMKKAMEHPDLKKLFIFKRITNSFSPEDIVELNNTIAASDIKQQDSTVAKYGGEMKNKFKKYQFGDAVPKDDVSITNPFNVGAFNFTPGITPTIPQPEANEVDKERLGIFDSRRTELHPAFQWLNAGAQLVTGVADMINNNKNQKYEKYQYLNAITPKYWENMEGEGLNANPIYTKYGGRTSMQLGGNAVPTIEAEKGEALMDVNGNVSIISDEANTHEQGGVKLTNVDRVLENTSSMRKDKSSKHLKLDPKQFKALTGVDSSRSMSHAQALKKAEEAYEKQRQKIVKNIELASKDRNNLDKYGEISTKLNMEHFAAIPTSQEIFDRLFDHQEAVKAHFNIGQEKTAKYGGKFQLAGYVGNKSGLKTPAGNPDAFPAKKDYTFNDYLDNISKQGFKYEGITNPQEFQLALYDYALKNNPEDIKKMWSEGMHQKGMEQAKKLGFVDNKGLFKPGVLDDPKNLEKLRSIYADGILGVRTLALNKKPPRIWSDDEAPTPLPEVNQYLDPTIKSDFTRVAQPENRFHEPLRWFDVASPMNAYLSALNRTPAKYNPVEFNQLRLKQLDPTVALQQNQSDFNAAVQSIQNTTGANSGVAAANIANLTAQKYAANNQVLGNYENQNAQIKNQEILYNTQVRDKQSLADNQQREIFENKVLEGMAKQQEQKLTALDSLYKTIAENRALNRNGNLIMKFSRAFDQYGNYNGYQQKFTINPALGIPNTSAYSSAITKGKTEAAGGVQRLEQGKSYYNRKTGKTLFFDGVNLIER